ncbi:MAG: glycosyltransferase family 4 protein [Nocardioidaceae bacterium]
MEIRFLIANAYTVGGTARTTYHLAGALARRHDVEVVSVFRTRPRPAFPVPDGVTVTPLVDARPRRLAARHRRPQEARVRRDIEAWLRSQPSRLIHHRDWRYGEFSLHSDLRLTRYLRSVRDGVLIGTRPGLNLAIARLAHPSVVKIGQEHINLASHHDQLLGALRRTYPRLDLCTTLTVEDRDTFRELLGPRVKVRCIPNGIATVPAAPRNDPHSKVVIAAGRYEYQKGFGLLIRAWEDVARKHPDWRLRIFGNGNRRASLQAIIDSHHLGDKVELMGYTKRLDSEMAAAAFFAMSSRYEGFPMTMLEAMATGLPVVSFDCLTGPRDLIDHGHNGFLVPTGNVLALGAAINRMIELGDGREAMGRAALQTARGYHVDTIGDRWLAVLEDLTDAGPVPTAQPLTL